jgi:hypothetical protein
MCTLLAGHALAVDLWHRTGVQLARTIPSYEEPFHAQSM